MINYNIENKDINFEQYGFYKSDKLEHIFIKYCFDWCATISKSKKKHYKWRIDFYEKPMYGKNKLFGTFITTAFVIDNIELKQWLISIIYRIPETSFLHNKIKKEKGTSYVKHKKFDSPNGFMVLTGRTKFNIAKDKKCEIMIGSTDLFPKGKILEVSTYDILPIYFTFPHPIRMPGIEVKYEPGPLNKETFIGCDDGKCEIAYGDKSKFITVDKYLSAFYIVQNMVSNKSIRNLNSINEIILDEKIRWFNYCPKCGGTIYKNIIKERATKY